jgi:hypothetical protein
LGQDIKACISVEDRKVTANSHGSDQTINEFAYGMSLLATGSVKHRCSIIVPRLHGKGCCSGQEAAQLLKVLLVAGASEHFHSNYVACRDFGGKQIVYSLTDRRTGIA